MGLSEQNGPIMLFMVALPMIIATLLHEIDAALSSRKTKVIRMQSLDNVSTDLSRCLRPTYQPTM